VIRPLGAEYEAINVDLDVMQREVGQRYRLIVNDNNRSTYSINLPPHLLYLYRCTSTAGFCARLFFGALSGLRNLGGLIIFEGFKIGAVPWSTEVWQGGC
jgi:hypothetical protein